MDLIFGVCLVLFYLVLFVFRDDSRLDAPDSLDHEHLNTPPDDPMAVIAALPPNVAASLRESAQGMARGEEPEPWVRHWRRELPKLSAQQRHGLLEIMATCATMVWIDLLATWPRPRVDAEELLEFLDHLQEHAGDAFERHARAPRLVMVLLPAASYRQHRLLQVLARVGTRDEHTALGRWRAQAPISLRPLVDRARDAILARHPVFSDGSLTLVSPETATGRLTEARSQEGGLEMHQDERLR